MLTIIVSAIAIVVVIVLIAAAVKPDNFRMQRSIDIQAPPEKIFPLIDDFHQWAAWSPWERIDLAMKKQFSGAAAGNGAVYGWEGNSKVGTGRMEITESLPPSRVLIKLDFLKPFEAHNIAEFTLEEKGDATTVTWVMHGPSPFISKLMSVFCSMDKLVGKDFETGLSSLKTAAEKR